MDVLRNIELRPHTGRMPSGQEVTFAQDQIFVNGVRAGYVGHKPGEGICLIRPADTATVSAIMNMVEEKRGTAAPYVQTAPAISDDRDDEDDDE